MMTERLKQIKIYTGKHFRLFINEKGWKVLIFAGIVSFLVSFVMQSSIFTNDFETEMGFFTLLSAAMWIGIFNTIQRVCKERDVLKREHRTGLHMSSYVASHMLFQLIVCALEAFILLVVSAVVLKYPTGKHLLIHVYFEYYITYFLVTYASDMLGLAISCIVKNTTTAMTVMPFVLIFQLLFAGTLFTLEGDMEKVSGFTVSRWGLQACCVSADYNGLQRLTAIETENQFRKVLSDNNISMTESQIRYALKLSKADIVPDIEKYTYSIEYLLPCWGLLLLQSFAYAGVGIIFLEFIDKDKR